MWTDFNNDVTFASWDKLQTMLELTVFLGRPYVVDECMLLFGCSSVLTVVNKRKVKFLDNYLKSCNNLCKLFAHVAANEKRGITRL